MQFQIAQNGLYANGTEYAGTNQKSTFTITNSLYPCKTPSPSLTLTKATTTDANSVTVNYNVSTNGLQSVHFAVYRGNTATIKNPTAGEQIGQQDIASGTQDLSGGPALQQGTHALKLISGVSLPPDTSKEFVSVVATYNGKSSSSYFRKWMLGALAHGFDREALEADHSLGLIGGYAVDPWEAQMAASLITNDAYDDVLQFDWMNECAVYEHGLAEAAGVNLATTVIAWKKGHVTRPGDVVDLHFIGHSRGAVVVTQTIADLNLASDPAFQGSYIKLTLLDPHPAYNTYPGVYAFGSWSSGLLGKAFKVATTYFQNVVKDPQVIISPGVRHTDIWYQHTVARLLSGEQFNEDDQNLWGMLLTPPLYRFGEAVVNNSGVPLLSSDLIDLTNRTLPGIGVIGHDEVPSAYIAEEVNPGYLRNPKY